MNLAAFILAMLSIAIYCIADAETHWYNRRRVWTAVIAYIVLCVCTIFLVVS